MPPKLGKNAYYTQEELEKLFEVIKGSGNLRDYIFYKLLFIMGKRACEICGNLKKGIPGLYVQDIDFNFNRITITQEKKGKWKFKEENGKQVKYLFERDTEILNCPKDLMQLLAQLIEEKKLGPRDRVFPISQSYFNRRLHEYLEEAKIPDKVRVLHGLRHSFIIEASQECQSAEDLRMVQKIAGHVNFTTTQGYWDIKKIKEGAIMDKINAKVRT